MKCEKIRGILLTDYLDGQLSAGIKKKVEAHLSRCGECREFLDSVRKTSVIPFKQVEEINPPEFVWQRIRADINKNRSDLPQKVPVFPGFLKRLFALPKPVYVLVSLIILTFVFFVKEKRDTASWQIQYQYLEYYASLTENGMEDTDQDRTLIEEYFL